jgi:hypothetical protein
MFQTWRTTTLPTISSAQRRFAGGKASKLGVVGVAVASHVSPTCPNAAVWNEFSRHFLQSYVSSGQLYLVHEGVSVNTGKEASTGKVTEFSWIWSFKIKLRSSENCDNSPLLSQQWTKIKLLTCRSLLLFLILSYVVKIVMGLARLAAHMMATFWC